MARVKARARRGGRTPATQDTRPTPRSTPSAPLRTTAGTTEPATQPGGVTGKGFLPGQSGNPGGRPRSERKLLERMFGDSGETLYRELHTLLRHPKTAAKLRADIAMFLIERLHGKAPQHVDIEAGGTGGGPIVFEVITNVPQPAERRDAD